MMRGPQAFVILVSRPMSEPACPDSATLRAEKFSSIFRLPVHSSSPERARKLADAFHEV